MKKALIISSIPFILIAGYLIIGLSYYNKSVECYKIRHSKNPPPDINNGVHNSPIALIFDMVFWPIYVSADIYNNTGIYSCIPIDE